jgi:hypothetical protein
VDLAAVYSREIDGEVLTFASSGWTYRLTFVLYDHQTESLWYHLEGTDGLTCISGTYADRFLPELGSVKTRWSTWFHDHPETRYWNYPQ